jgi:beta-1,2-mannobiose phosphorylase / 1,2-beta-oligomannan phosphorylase
MKTSRLNLDAQFARLGTVLMPEDKVVDERQGVLNPASARLRDGSLQLYPRMVAQGNISRIGSFHAEERPDGSLKVEQWGYALEPTAPYELRDADDGYGCEDPRVTYVRALDRYVMAYVAFGPRGPEVAAAISDDGLRWERLGLIKFRGSAAPFADKDAAFFPEPVRSPKGIESLAFYHRPSLPWSVTSRDGGRTARPTSETIAIGYMPFAPVQADPQKLCEVTETHHIKLPAASWGTIKVGAGTPPVRTDAGWLSVMHGVDRVEGPSGDSVMRYSAGLIVHDPERIAEIVYRSPSPLFSPEATGEIRDARQIVFPTAIDPRSNLPGKPFDIYYGMADFSIGRGRLRILSAAE